MSQPAYAITPATFDTEELSFTVADTTVAKILIDALASAAAVSSLPPFYGGGSILDLVANSTDGTNRDAYLWFAKVLTTQDAALTGAITLSAQNTLTRLSGSWIADKFKVGQKVMLFAPNTVAQTVTGIDGIVATITALTATVMTVNGTPWAAGTPVLAAGTRICKVHDDVRATVTANAGSSANIPSVSFLGTQSDGALVRDEKKFGAADIIAMSMQANISALPAVVSFKSTYARY